MNYLHIDCSSPKEIINLKNKCEEAKQTGIKINDSANKLLLSEAYFSPDQRENIEQERKSVRKIEKVNNQN